MNHNGTFLAMPLSDGMKQTISSIGFNSPTPIQHMAIPVLLQGADLLGQAQTGTGKTAAFAVPLIEMIDENTKGIQALVVCPTRELCLQVCQELRRLSAHKLGLEVEALYGGQSIEQQFKSLKVNSPQIVVATPGRLFDHLRRKSVTLSQVRMIVLDEADEMLDMGFRPEIEQIFDLLPEENQRIFFSATMAKAIKDLACTYPRNPKIIKTESKTLTVSTIAQNYFRVRGREKTELLCRLIDLKNPKLAVVFCNAKSTADEIVDEVIRRGFAAGVLHGDLSQNQRDRVMAKFKSGLIKVLIATDVAARGLDIDDVELVVNFHLPHDPEDYVHRIGRTGRAGRAGCAVSLVEPRDNTRLRRICQFANIEISEQQPPSLDDVKAAKLNVLFSEVKAILSSDKIGEYRAIVTKQKMNAEDIAAGTIHLSLKKFDEKVNEEIFEGLSEKRYSGYTSEKRHKDKSNRYDAEARGSKYKRQGNSRRPTKDGEPRQGNRNDTKFFENKRERPYSKAVRSKESQPQDKIRTQQGPYRPEQDRRDGNQTKSRRFEGSKSAPWHRGKPDENSRGRKRNDMGTRQKPKT